MLESGDSFVLSLVLSWMRHPLLHNNLSLIVSRLWNSETLHLKKLWVFGMILLMVKILHQLIGSLSHYAQGLTSVLHILGGAGFLPSTAPPYVNAFHAPYSPYNLPSNQLLKLSAHTGWQPQTAWCRKQPTPLKWTHFDYSQQTMASIGKGWKHFATHLPGISQRSLKWARHLAAPDFMAIRNSPWPV